MQWQSCKMVNNVARVRDAIIYQGAFIIVTAHYMTTHSKKLDENKGVEPTMIDLAYNQAAIKFHCVFTCRQSAHDQHILAPTVDAEHNPRTSLRASIFLSTSTESCCVPRSSSVKFCQNVVGEASGGGRRTVPARPMTHRPRHKVESRRSSLPALSDPGRAAAERVCGHPPRSVQSGHNRRGRWPATPQKSYTAAAAAGSGPG
jgi:hypothetical protein